MNCFTQYSGRALCCLIGLFLLSCDIASTIRSPKAMKGVLDLRQWSFEENGNVTLNGEWKFYWNQLLQHSDFGTPSLPVASGFAQVPSVWKNFHLDTIAIHGQGYATYRLVVKTNRKTAMALKLGDIATAAAIYVDGQKIFEAGKVGTSRQTMRPQFVSDFVQFFASLFSKLFSKTLLKIIFNDLISNAIRYCNPHQADPFVRITIEADAAQANVTVSDNGQGIAEEYLEKIFTMFYRASDDAKGSDLGLFLVKETVQKLQGEVRVSSVLHQGTKFYLTIPKSAPMVHEIETVAAEKIE